MNPTSSVNLNVDHTYLECAHPVVEFQVLAVSANWLIVGPLLLAAALADPRLFSLRASRSLRPLVLRLEVVQVSHTLTELVRPVVSIDAARGTISTHIQLI